MRVVRVLAGHPLTGSGVRYGISGLAVAAVYLGVPVVLSGSAGVPIELVIPIAYVLAISLHFTLQRHFVFRHITGFALSRRQQVARYVLIGSVQYPTTAIATALLPGLLGLSSRATYVVTSLTMSLIFFLVLRVRVFHASIEPDPSPADPQDPGRLDGDQAIDDEVVVTRS